MTGIRRYLTIIVAFAAIAALLGGSAKVLFPVKYKEIVIERSRENGLDPSLVFAVIKVESKFRPNALSYKNARGLMQISETTALWGSEELGMVDFQQEDLYNPEINIAIGCWYLGVLMREFGNETDLVIAAYNGGSGNVNQWLNDTNTSTSGRSLDRIPFPETALYLKKVKNYVDIYKKLYENEF